MRLSLEEASQHALRAAEAGDLDALAQALEARGAAIAAGDPPTDASHAAGEKTILLLQAFMRSAGMESMRLKHLQEGFSTGRENGASHLDCRG